MSHNKLILSRLAAGFLAFTIALTITGCASNGPSADTTTSITLSAATDQEQTTTPNATAPNDTDTEPTPSSENTKKDPSPTSTEPPATEAPTTEPPATDPPETEPPATTEHPHNHSYSAVSTVAPSCDEEGYTVYKCDCGSSYTDDETSATGHSWSDWTVTKEATSSAEGEQARTCSACGATETATIEKLPAVQIDTAALEEYGRQYGKNTYGYNPVIGTRAGYFPGATFNWDSMDEAYADVAGCVDATTTYLVAAGWQIVAIINGKECAAMLDVDVIHEGGTQYCVWVYYG